MIFVLFLEKVICNKQSDSKCLCNQNHNEKKIFLGTYMYFPFIIISCCVLEEMFTKPKLINIHVHEILWSEPKKVNYYDEGC